MAGSLITSFMPFNGNLRSARRYFKQYFIYDLVEHLMVGRRNAIFLDLTMDVIGILDDRPFFCSYNGCLCNRTGPGVYVIGLCLCNRIVVAGSTKQLCQGLGSVRVGMIKNSINNGCPYS